MVLVTPNTWVRYKVHGDQRAKEELTLENLSLVKYVAERIKDNLPPEVEREDLVSYGVFGLMDAIEKFDHNRGIKFETYAIPRIRGAILDGLRAYDIAPRSLRQKAKVLGKAFTEVELRLGRTATDQEVAEELNIDLEAFNAMQAAVSRLPLLSLDDFVVQDDGGEITLGQRIEDKSSYNPVELLESTELSTALVEAIDSLNEQERLVVTLYFYEGLTLREASEVLELSESRISQIRLRAVAKLRAHMSEILY
ncbi:MAG: FliA/WhiG family RNA polymerase sigma factor [Candidatus Aquicultor sp.]|nr:FliA/WhiG family RNA polymerase sigma factor [Candidatus Aquicultor sp.]